MSKNEGTSSDVGIRIASNISYNIPERWIEGFADKYQGLIIKGKSTKFLLEQIQGFDHKFDWNDKLKCKVHI